MSLSVFIAVFVLDLPAQAIACLFGGIQVPLWNKK